MIVDALVTGVNVLGIMFMILVGLLLTQLILWAFGELVDFIAQW